MPRVFVPQIPRRKVNGELKPVYDLSPAREHGEMVELTSPSAKPWTPSVADEMRSILSDVTEEDAILMVGSPVMTAMAVAIMARQLDGYVRMLQWNGFDRQYFVVETELWPA